MTGINTGLGENNTITILINFNVIIFIVNKKITNHIFVFMWYTRRTNQAMISETNKICLITRNRVMEHNGIDSVVLTLTDLFQWPGDLFCFFDFKIFEHIWFF